MKQFIKNTLTVLSIASTLLISGCKENLDLGIGPIENAKANTNECSILNINGTNSLNVGITYDENDKPIGISGFKDFNQFVYNGDVLEGARNSQIDSYEVVFDFDSDDLLTLVTFKGTNESGVFENQSILSYDGENRLVELSLSFPVFDESVVVKIEYNDDGNVTFVKKVVGNQLETILENKTFDDNKSPFLDQKLGKILAYFMVYNLLEGEDNFSYFLNKNNVTSSVIRNNSNVFEISRVYEYNQKGYPISAEITKFRNGRLGTGGEFFGYECE